MDIIYSATPAKLAGEKLEGALLKNSGRPMLLLLSGGSAFSLLDYLDTSSLGERLTVGVLDERCSADPEINNFAQLEKTTFFKAIVVRGVSVIDTKLKAGETCEDLAVRFADALIKWRGDNADGFVVVTMGIGNDGHTAGIFPGERAVNFVDEKLVVAYSVPKTVNVYTNRVTATYNFLTSYVDEAIVFAVGSEKKIIIESLKSGEFNLVKIPASILNRMSKVTLFTSE